MKKGIPSHNCSVPHSTPTPHPEWEALVSTRNALNAEIAAVIADLHAIEDSRFVVIGQYSEAFGDRLVRLGGMEIEAARLKREIELVQAMMNAGREIDYDAIEEALSGEFADWQAKLEELAQGFAEDRRVLDHLIDPGTTERIRKAFRILVRRLHPDLHPEQALRDAELWHRVLAAYEANDLDELDALEVLTRKEEMSSVNPSGNAVDVLRDEISSRRAQLDRLLNRMADMRKRWPFDQIALLDDKEATKLKQTELDQRIEVATALRDERLTWLDGLLGR